MQTYDVAVIGAGVFGSWTAWHLRRAGASVLLVDAWGPGNSRSSSGGESRIIRAGYGADAIYTRMAMDSLVQWKALFERRAVDLYHRTGVLWIAREGHHDSDATQRTLRECGCPMSVLTRAEVERRWPALHLPEGDVYGIYEPEGGALMARQAVRIVVEDSGADYRGEQVFWPTRIPAATFVFACGPWLPKVFPELLRARIRPTRQAVVFFDAPKSDIPIWLDFTDARRPYGFPDIDGRGIKISLDRRGPAFDPDGNDRLVTAEELAAARGVLADRFPHWRDAPVTESRVCQYEETPSGDFVIDRHPEFENVWVAGGGSGHGFKHGPAVGRYLCDRILKGAPAEPRFSL